MRAPTSAVIAERIALPMATRCHFTEPSTGGQTALNTAYPDRVRGGAGRGLGGLRCPLHGLRREPEGLRRSRTRGIRPLAEARVRLGRARGRGTSERSAERDGHGEN